MECNPGCYTSGSLSEKLKCTLMKQGWLHAGSVVVADNIKFPGAPDYSAYMDSEEGKTWRTKAHETHVEYQSVMKDIVLESTYLG